MLVALITFIFWAIAKFFSKQYKAFMASNDTNTHLPIYIFFPYLIGIWFVFAFCLWIPLALVAVCYQRELSEFTNIGIDDFAFNYLFLGTVIVSVIRPIFIYKKYKRHCKELEK